MRIGEKSTRRFDNLKRDVRFCGLRYAPALSSAIAPGDREILGHRQRNPI
jgi:hypothetical protein